MAVKTLKLTPVAAFLALTFTGAHAMAEDGMNEVDGDVEVIRVSGTRASLSEAMNEKRFSDAQVDVIAAEDIGVMPDPDIGDSLERVAGVQVQRSENGEAREVNVRGLPGYFTKTLYNGRSISTPLNSNRNFSYQIMPSAFISQVSVQKSSAADLNEGGISGTVDMRSHRAFMANDRVVRAVAKTTYDGNTGEFGPDLSFIFSDKFADDTIGIAFGANYLKEDNHTQIQNGNQYGSKWWNDPEDSDAERLYGTSQLRYELNNSERERAAVFANIEWRPTDNLSLFAESFYTDYQSAENRQRFAFNTGTQTQLKDYEEVMVDGNRYVTQMTLDGVNSFVEASPISRDADVMVNTFEAQYELGDWQIKGAYSMVRSDMLWNASGLKSDLVSSMDNVTFYGTGRSPWGTDYGNLDEIGLDLTNPSSYGAMYLDSSNFGTTQESNSDTVALDATRFTDITLGDHAVITKMSFGASYAMEEMKERSYDVNLDESQFAEMVEALGLNTPGFVHARPANGDWFDGANGTAFGPRNWITPDVDGLFAQTNFAAVRAFAEAEQARCDANVDCTNKSFAAYEDNLFEDTLAAYFRADFEIGYNLTGNIGLRYVRTEQITEKMDVDWTQGLYVTGSNNNGPTYDFVAEREFHTATQTDHQFLPSLNLKYDMRDDMDFRFGVSRTMARPNKNDLVGSTRVSTPDGEPTINTTEATLDPFIANNVDMTWSWFYNEDSMVSAAYFYKNLETFVRMVERYEEVSVEGQDDPIEVLVRSRSNEEGLDLHGLELAYQTAFSNLPGLLSNTGLQANYTFIHNSEPELLAAASEHNANVTLYYSTRALDLRLSHNYRAGYLQNAADGLIPATYYDDQNRTTLAASYRPVRGLRLTASVSNLFDNDSHIYTDGGITRAFNDAGRKFNMGMVYSF
ncbi:TonB-dependent receptor [Ferrimonas pelagia]